MKKRVLSLLSLLLAVMMVFTLLPTATFATNGSDFTIENGVLKKYNGAGGDVVLPDSVTSIGEGAFQKCSSLNSVTIPDSVTEIGEYAFQRCGSLTSATIPNSVTAIGEGAFYKCSSLISLSIPNSVTLIEDSAFEYCSSLTSVTIPDSVTSIGEGAFYKCSNLTDIFYGGSKEQWNTIEIGTNNEYLLKVTIHCSGNENFVINDSDFVIENGVLIKYIGAGGDVIIPDEVTSVGDSAFEYCGSLISVTIPNSVTLIGGEAFFHCSSLISVTIPNSVTSIGENAFDGTPWLKAQGEFVIVNGILLKYQGNDSTVTIPNSVTSIGDSAFEKCKSLTSVVIPDLVTSIGSFAFYGCIGLTSITIPDLVTYIGGNAFNGCTSLTSVTIGNSVTNIEYGTFSSCTGLTSITIPNSVTSIGSSAFYGCTGLISITIPDSVTEIGDNAFKGCTDLASVTIPNSVISIGSYAFCNCEGLTFIKISDSATNVGGSAFEGCDGLKKILGIPVNLIVRLGVTQDAIIGYQGKNDTVFNQWAITAEATLRGVEHYVSAQSEKVTNLSNEICNGLTSDYEKAKAIFDWMTANVAYDHDYYYGRKKTVIWDPDGVIESKLTVCSGYAKLTQALLQAQGIPALYIVGGIEGADHAWNAAYIEGKWIYIDSTWGRPWVNNNYAGYNLNQFDIGIDSLTMRRTAVPITYGIYSVQASSSTVTVNGTPIGFECYNIGGNNYFKLRDLAAALNGSQKQFNVTWDGEKGAVNILSEQAYTAVGGELTLGDGTAKEGQVNTASVFVDGYWVLLSSYNIGGNNYFKLRDLAKVLDFGVSWDGTTGTVRIDSSVGYTE